MAAKKTAMKAGKAAVKAKQRKAPELSREQIDEVATLLKNAGSVEIKLVVPMPSHRATLAKLGVDPIETEVRQVYFFDTPDLDLNKAGVVVRARRIQGGAGDTVVKLRPVDPAAIALRDPDRSHAGDGPALRHRRHCARGRHRRAPERARDPRASRWPG